MNKEVKQKWMEALLSGEYKQGQNKLRANDCYCCLGVLVDLYVKEKGTEGEKKCWKESALFPNVEEDRRGEFEADYLPKKIRDWAGLNEANPFVKSRSECIGYLNDVFDYSFISLAEIIEKEF